MNAFQVPQLTCYRILHAITAAFHEVRDRYKEHRVKEQHVKEAHVDRDGTAAY